MEKLGVAGWSGTRAEGYGLVIRPDAGNTNGSAGFESCFIRTC